MVTFCTWRPAPRRCCAPSPLTISRDWSARTAPRASPPATPPARRIDRPECEDGPMPAMTLRPIRATEWRQARDLRLRALQDQDAAIAFFTTYAEATARTEEQWRSSTAAVSVD